MELSDIQTVTLDALRTCCERLGFESLGATDGHRAESTSIDDRNESSILSSLDVLYDLEATPRPLDDEKNIAALTQCVQKIDALDLQRKECEQVGKVLKLVSCKSHILEYQRAQQNLRFGDRENLTAT